jgi:hypothetical protein
MDTDRITKLYQKQWPQHVQRMDRQNTKTGTVINIERKKEYRETEEEME